MTDRAGPLTMQDAAVAVGDGLALRVPGFGVAAVQLTGTFVATVTFEASVADVNAAAPVWVAVPAVNINTGAIGTTATAAGIYSIPVPGLSLLRARISTYTSGTVTATGRAVESGVSPNPLSTLVDSAGNPLSIQAAGADNESNTANLLRVASRLYGFDGATWDRLSTAGGDGISSGTLQTFPYMVNAGGTHNKFRTAQAHADTGGGDQLLAIQDFHYTGSAYERRWGNADVALLTSAARTATASSGVQTLRNGSRIDILLDVTANPGGAETLTIEVLFGNSQNAGFYGSVAANFLTAAATNSQYHLIVGPGCSTAPENATRNKAYALAVPRTYVVRVTHSGAGSWTYSLNNSVG